MTNISYIRKIMQHRWRLVITLILIGLFFFISIKEYKRYRLQINAYNEFKSHWGHVIFIDPNCVIAKRTIWPKEHVKRSIWRRGLSCLFGEEGFADARYIVFPADNFNTHIDAARESFANVEVISFANSQVDNVLMRKITCFNNLKGLDFHKCVLSVKISSLEYPREIEYLSFVMKQGSEEFDLRWISGLEKIEVLNIAAGTLDIESLASLPIGQHVRAIRFEGCNLFNVEGFSKFENCRHLMLSGSNIGDNELFIILKQMPALETLSLRDTAITGKSLTAIKQLTSLTALDIRNTFIQPTDITILINSLSECEVIYK